MGRSVAPCIISSVVTHTQSIIHSISCTSLTISNVLHLSCSCALSFFLDANWCLLQMTSPCDLSKTSFQQCHFPISHQPWLCFSSPTKTLVSSWPTKPSPFSSQCTLPAHVCCCSQWPVLGTLWVTRNSGTSHHFASAHSFPLPEMPVTISYSS